LGAVFLLITLSGGPQTAWEPSPVHKKAAPETVVQRDEFNPFRWLILSSIRLYQKSLSRAQGDVCNFTPSCSQYGYEAIRKYGLFYGTAMATDRVERCNYSCWSYSPRYYDVRRVEGRGFKLWDPPERNWLFRRDIAVSSHPQPPMDTDSRQ